jgi:pterin-4a-carbinolamine dehydratase
MDWKVIDNRFVKTYKDKSFSSIIEKLNVLAKKADEQKHHPDFAVFEYNKIRFELWTHSANSVTAADYKMAEIIDTLFG